MPKLNDWTKQLHKEQAAATSRRSRWRKILGKKRNSLSRPTTVHFQLKTPITVEMGKVVDLEFAVGLVRKPGLLATLARRKNAIQILQKSVDASPGMVFVTYSQLEDTPVISFETTGPQPNAVAQLTSLQDVSFD